MRSSAERFSCAASTCSPSTNGLRQIYSSNLALNNRECFQYGEHSQPCKKPVGKKYVKRKARPDSGRAGFMNGDQLTSFSSGARASQSWHRNLAAFLADDHLLVFVHIDNGAVAFADPAGEEFFG